MIKTLIITGCSAVALILIILVILLIIKGTKKIVNKITYWDTQNEWLEEEFRRCNVIVFGKKGSGKDLLFALVINLRNELHYSNIRYNGFTEVIRVKDISVGENTFINNIDDTVAKEKPKFAEQADFYISDAGIFLSSQYDKELDNIYPSMPIFYALSRHLYSCNIHANVQNLGRIWKKLREQADSYIWVRGKVDCGEYIIITTVCYDRYESANRMLLPSNDKQYNATNGEIIERKFKIYKNILEYNTRYFKDVFLDYEQEWQPKNRLEEIINHGFRE